MDTRYCKLYISSSDSYETLSVLIQNSSFCLSKKRRFIKNQYFEMCLLKNDDVVVNSSDFLFWPYLIEIDRVCDLFEDFVKQLNDFLRFLRENNIQVVASCDFEELLGQKPGFYNETEFV